MKKIFCVTHDIHTQTIFKMVLNQCNIEWELFDNVEIAYKCCMSSPPSALIVSSKLIGTASGLDLIAILRKKGKLKGVIIILLTEEGGFDPVFLKHIGVNEVLNEPISLEDLKFILDHYLGLNIKGWAGRNGIHADTAKTFTKGEVDSLELEIPNVKQMSSKCSVQDSKNVEVEYLNNDKLEDITLEEKKLWGMADINVESSKNVVQPNHSMTSVDSAQEIKDDVLNVGYSGYSLEEVISIMQSVSKEVIESLNKRLYEQLHEILLSFNQDLKTKMDNILKEDLVSWIRGRFNEEIKKHLKSL